MNSNEQMEKLLHGGSVTLGYVYQDGKRDEYWFEGTPENMASFLARFPAADKVILTDSLDNLVLNSFGSFIDTCPDKELLGQVLQYLIPMQMGEAEPAEFFCPTVEDVEKYADGNYEYGNGGGMTLD